MVGNLRAVKGPDVFIRAAALVAKRRQDVDFELAGAGDPEDEASLRKLIDECGLAGRLTLRGRVWDVPGFLANVDVAVLTSRSEALSNAVIEYMAAGLPIVATAVGGAEELIDDGEHGLLVPAEAPDAAAAAIERLVRDPEFASRLGQQARQRAAARYTRDRMVRRFEALFQRLLACEDRNKLSISDL